MTPEKFVGALREIFKKGWRKPVQVRIVDYELASGVCNHDPRCGSDGVHVWYWAKYS